MDLRRDRGCRDFGGRLFLGRYTSSKQSAEVPAKSIAVLPFDNQNRDPDTDYSLTVFPKASSTAFQSCQISG